jgi:hypothetical protein
MLFTNNFSKSNFTSAASVVFIVYIIWINLKKKDSIQIRLALFTQAAVLGLTTLSVVAFSAMYTFLLIIIVRQKNKKGHALCPAIYILLGVYGLLCVINYRVLGVADLSLVDKQMRYGLFPESTNYLNVLSCAFLTMLFKETYAHVSSLSSYLENIRQLAWGDIVLQNAFSPWGWLVSAIGLLGGVFIPRLRKEAATAWTIVLLLAIQIVTCAILQSRYIMMHSTFLFGLCFSAAIYILGLHLAVSIIGYKNARLKLYLSSIAAMTILINALIHFPQNIRDDIRERFEFFTALKSYHAIYSGYYPELTVCDTLLASIGENEKIIPLSPFSPCSPYTLERVIDPVTSFFGNDIRSLVSASPKDAMKILRRFEADHIVVDLDDQATTFLFFPLFQPDEILKYFIIEKNLGGAKYLLRSRMPTNTSDTDEAFLLRYRVFYDRAQQSPANTLYRAAQDIALGKVCAACASTLPTNKLGSD